MLYIHIPFCASKCGYCGFNSFLGDKTQKARYLNAMCVDLRESVDLSLKDESAGLRPNPHLLFASQKVSKKIDSHEAIASATSGVVGGGGEVERGRGATSQFKPPPPLAKMRTERDSSENENGRNGESFGKSKNPKDSRKSCNKNQHNKPTRYFDSIYIGGGTPNTLSPKDFERIFKILSPKIAPHTEITMELNPNASSFDTLRAFKDLGINRFSIGVQSFCEDKLKLLERTHNPKIAQKFIENALNCGVSVSIDLIYDTILDSSELLRFELENALNLGVGHISCYALSIDENSAFFAKNKNPTREPSLCYELKAILESNGFAQYEVSNFARNHKSRHNLGYWAYKDYIGVGLGAVGKITGKNGIYRTYKNSDFGAYLANPSAFRRENLSPSDIKLEKIFLGLRSEVGVEREILGESARLNMLIKNGKIRAKNGRIYAKNYFLADEIALWLENH